MTRLFLLASVVCFAAAPALAQGDTGFLRGTGKADFVFSWTQDSYDSFWIGDDKVSPADVGEITREAWTLYGAYGLREDMDLVVSGSYVSSESDGLQADAGNPVFEDRDDFQDATIGVKWRLWNSAASANQFSFLFAPAIKFPMSDYEGDAVTAIGDQQVDLRARVIAHWQSDSGLYASLESGYDRRNGAPSDEIPVNLTIGATMFGRLTVSPFYSTVDSRGGYDIGEGPFPGTQEEFERAGVGAYFRITEQFGLTGLWKTTLDGKNTGDADSYGAGLVFRML
jgi:hypothetical protein